MTDATERPLEVLALVMECRRPTGGGAALALSEVEEVDIGRGPARHLEAPHGLTGQVRITVRDSRMSSTHARIRRTGSGWCFEDLGSANGTHLDGERLPRGELRPGAVLRVGHTLFMLCHYDPASAAGFADKPWWVDGDPEGETYTEAVATLSPTLRARLRDGSLDEAGLAHISLSERREDVGLCVAAVLRTLGASELRLRPEVGHALIRHDWRDDPRALERCMKECIAVAGEETVVLNDLPPSVAGALSGPVTKSEPPASMAPRAMGAGALGKGAMGKSAPPAAAFAPPRPPRKR